VIRIIKRAAKIQIIKWKVGMLKQHKKKQLWMKDRLKEMKEIVKMQWPWKQQQQQRIITLAL